MIGWIFPKSFVSTGFLLCLLCVFGLFGGVQYAAAQDNISVKFIGLSWHPYGEATNSFLMPLRLDKDAYFVVNLGGMISYEKFLHKDIFSVKAIQGLYFDCAAQLGGFTHIGLRGRVFRLGRHRLYGGIGPTLMYRRNWQLMEGYTPSALMKGGPEDPWQHLFLWYGGELEYRFDLNERWDLSSTIIPGFPHVVVFTAGANYKFLKGKAQNTPAAP